MRERVRERIKFLKKDTENQKVSKKRLICNKDSARLAFTLSLRNINKRVMNNPLIMKLKVEEMRNRVDKNGS